MAWHGVGEKEIDAGVAVSQEDDNVISCCSEKGKGDRCGL